MQRLLAAIALLAALPALAQDRPLRVAITQSASPPFVQWRDNQPVAGLDVELARAVAVQLRIPVELLPLPRARVEAALAGGDADLACNITPPAGARALPASAALFETQDLLLGHESAPPVDTPDQLAPNSVIGTVQGQSSAALEGLINDGRLKRDEAQSEEKLLRKLALNRHPYGVGSQPSVSWYTSQEPIDGIAPWRAQLGARAYRCFASPRGRIEAPQLLAVIEQLHAAGRIGELVNQHAAAPLAVVVSARSAVRGISYAHLVEVFMGQRQRLADGNAPAPVMSAGAEREQFFNTVLKRGASEFRSAWAAQQFGGRRRPPLQLTGTEAVKAHLQRHADAIGYLPLALVDASLRIVYLP
ncbi:transporter substrate-binding domain-containing protein [Roseateles asaccharophilus]|uniref:ABC-type amino acid transport substrate-binding protein n=1 Tax=Roseateles asaccharophilus TaxID=582607 RepID=A0ABU2A820_9BURK|nr:transporter substrate-binding domain-containing protein [Roseateles asaccharophilus]MDR7332178.1 ABC-type amino acid transport substrate-binding protein [Roseateles asaccharophilus]